MQYEEELKEAISEIKAIGNLFREVESKQQEVDRYRRALESIGKLACGDVGVPPELLKEAGKILDSIIEERKKEGENLQPLFHDFTKRLLAICQVIDDLKL